MLKQILSDMYVDPELLAELSEEQKQILFFKMRQEQLRRWEAREAAATLEEASRKRGAGKAHGKSVQWKLGADGDVWVWVMGEHPLDQPYDRLCGELIAERERRQPPQGAEAPRCPREASTEPSAASPDTKLHLEVERVRENSMGQEMLKGVAPAVGSAPHQEGIQTVISKSRGVEQMLADSIRQSQKQRKDAQMRTTMNQSQTQGEVAINPVDKSVQNAEKEDPVWLESLRRSKAADERRRSLAKHARDDYKRLSLQGKHKGKAADVSRPCEKGEQRRMLPPPPPLPPKPKTLPPRARLANGPLARKQGVQRSISSSTQESIIQWFQTDQLPLRAGLEKETDRVAPWFHDACEENDGERTVIRPASMAAPRSSRVLTPEYERPRGWSLSHIRAISASLLLQFFPNGCFFTGAHISGPFPLRKERHILQAQAGKLFKCTSFYLKNIS